MNAEVDIAVVGSGAAGIAAAVSAARAGCSTVLIERRATIGGTGGWSGLTTLCGLYDDEGRFLNGGFSREFAEALAETAPIKMGKLRVLPYRPQRFREVAARFLSSLPNLQICPNTALANVVLDRNRIVNLNSFHVGAVIDCSGTAEVARAVGARCLETDHTTQAPAIVFALRNVTRSMTTAADAAQVLLPLARAGLPPLNFQPNLEPNTVTVKFTGSAEQAPKVIEFLRMQITGFEKCESIATMFAPAERAGRMIVGQYVMSAKDVLMGRKFPDAVARCAWPIEQWSQDGIARFRYLPRGTNYEIPAGSLRAHTVQNLFMAGKTISADVDAIASARVMGCCLATGEAAGKLAAQSARTACVP